MASSKTARRSTPSGPAGKFQPDATASRIIPLHEGAGAYVLNATDGRLARFNVDSDGFRAALADLVAVLGVERVRRDLNEGAVHAPAWAELATNLESLIAPSESGDADPA